jgi:hypothetical protein
MSWLFLPRGYTPQVDAVMNLSQSRIMTASRGVAYGLNPIGLTDWPEMRTTIAIDIRARQVPLSDPRKIYRGEND